MDRQMGVWVAAFGLLLAAGPVLGDGVMIRREGNTVTDLVKSPKQEAVLITDGKIVEIVLRTHFRAGPEELAWVAPVPGRPRDIKAGQDDLFRALQAGTAPSFYKTTVHRRGLGCTCGMASPVQNRLEAPVRVVETGTAGVFEFVVLSATDARALEAWLRKHHYAIPPGADKVFAKYLGGRWHWLAMRVRPEQADKPTLAPHPIRYRYDSGQLIYPLIISQLSSDLENEIVLYVIAPSRYACANWANTDVAALTKAGKRVRPSKVRADYEKLVRKATTRQGGQLFVTEYAGTNFFIWQDKQTRGIVDGLPESLRERSLWLTRLRAMMTPRAMNRDVSLLPVTSGTVTNEYELSAGGSGGRPTVWLAPVVAVSMLCGAMTLLPRRRALRTGGIVCIVLCCAVLVMM